MKEFEYYLNAGLVNKKAPDKNTALATAREGQDRIILAGHLLGAEKPKYALENAYEAVREFLDAVLYLEGYKSRSHEATISYLLKLGFSISEVSLIDKLREQRHRIKYYGGDASDEEAHRAVHACEEIIKKITAIKLKELK